MRVNAYRAPLAAVLLLIVTSPVLSGQPESDRLKQVLQIIRGEVEFACQRPLSRGQRVTAGAKAEADVRLKGMLKSIVGLGGKVAVDAAKVTWTGTALDQYARAQESGNLCAVEIYKLFIGMGLVPRESAPRAPAPPVADTRGAFLAEFSARTPDWWTGEASDMHGRVTRDVAAGTYTWKLFFDQDVSSFPVNAPYPASEAFEVAVDVNFFPVLKRSATREGRIYRRASDYSAGLIFGKSEGSEYLFRIGQESSGRARYGLHRYDERGFTAVLDWTQASIDLGQVNRLAVTVANGLARMYINKKLVDEFRLRDFKGGRVGLDATGTRGQWIDVDFDNFEFKRTGNR
jgi:hypothetical protein